MDPLRSSAPSTIHASRYYKRPTASATDNVPWAARAPRKVSSMCRTQVTAEQVHHFQKELEDIDNASLIQSNFEYEVYPSDDGSTVYELVYTVNLVLDNSEWDLAPMKGKEYKLAVDTGDCSFWMYEKNFQKLQFVRLLREEMTDNLNETHKYITTDWSDVPLHLRQRVRRRRAIPPSAAPIAEISMLKYGDNGELRVKRWFSNPGVDLLFKAPVWNWIVGQSEHSLPDQRLQFARVLADAVNTTTATQGVDGNLGLGVPGWRQPWSFAGSKDRATFFDVLNHGPGVVPKPMCATVRLLPPNEYALARANHRVQSFLYYGIGAPCGFLGYNGKIVIPEYTPRLYIFPDAIDVQTFRWWTMQLLSITLLEPLVDFPNYETSDFLEWFPRRIPVGEISTTGTSGGVSVIFDSGATCSVLPRAVLQAIWTQWFYNDIQSYPQRAVFMRHARDFSKHDILFEFQDFFGTTTTLRCSAQDFLDSPWDPSDGFPGRLACFAESVQDQGPFILGMNFFWTSLVRFDATHRGDRPVPGQVAPYIQFAPQRILTSGIKLAGPWELEIHADLPPNMQAVLRGQPELQA